MNTCKTCKHWDKETHARSPVEKTGGTCSSGRIMECSDLGAHEPDTITYSYDEGGWFWAGPEFGCVHHKEASHVDQRQG